jgi:site-specific recombinase XerD
MLFDGLRSREAIDVQLEDLRLSQAQILIRGKAKRQRVLPLPDQTIEALERYVHLERPLTNSPYLFVSLKGPHRGRPMTAAGLRSLFRHHRRQTNVRTANPHRFRHTFGADMVRAGVSLPALMNLMGHSNIHTTMLYVQLSPQDVWREYHRAIAKKVRFTPPVNP